MDREQEQKTEPSKVKLLGDEARPLVVPYLVDQ